MTDFRAELHRLMLATVADEHAHGNWTYRAVRPMPVPTSYVSGGRVYGDCSKGVQFLNRWVGAPDPMRESYDAYGNSYTLWLRCQHLDRPSDLRVGDFVTFGRIGEKHAAMVMEEGPDPLLWSFGHEGAPNTYRLSHDRRPAQYLRNPLPVYVPTPDDKLRAKTGWFSWVAWRLGEGDWHDRGKAAPKLRPNVPKVIPARWWVDLGRFLASRKKANKPTTK